MPSWPKPRFFLVEDRWSWTESTQLGERNETPQRSAFYFRFLSCSESMRTSTAPPFVFVWTQGTLSIRDLGRLTFDIATKRKLDEGRPKFGLYQPKSFLGQGFWFRLKKRHVIRSKLFFINSKLFQPQSKSAERAPHRIWGRWTAWALLQKW